MSVPDSCRTRTLTPAALRFLVSSFACLIATAAFGASANDDQVIVPKTAPAVPPPAAGGGTGTGALTIVGVIALVGAGGWMLWRARAGGLNQFSRAPRHLTVEETRSLGNRQYLVVASYQDKKFLIGVCPGRIDLLSALNAPVTIETERLRG